VAIVKAVRVEVKTNLPPAESRINWEDGAYLFVDLHYEPPVRASKWRLLRGNQAFVIDLAPTGEPVLLEVRQPWETWRAAKGLIVPEFRAEGSAKILTSGRVSMPIAVTSDADRTTIRVTFGFPEPGEFIRVASSLVFEVARVVREDMNVLSGQLVGLWIFDVPRLSPITSLLRALRVAGPPIGGETSRVAPQISKPVTTITSPGPRPRH